MRHYEHDDVVTEAPRPTPAHVNAHVICVVVHEVQFALRVRVARENVQQRLEAAVHVDFEHQRELREARRFGHSGHEAGRERIGVILLLHAVERLARLLLVGVLVPRLIQPLTCL